jgi:hypothetical protein
MSSVEPTPIDCPTRDAVTVVNLLQSDARGYHDVFHLRSVLNSSVGIGVKRLDEDAPTSACQAGMHERSRVFSAQQPGLDTYASGEQ